MGIDRENDIGGGKTPAGRSLSLQTLSLVLTLAVSIIIAGVLSYELALNLGDAQSISDGVKAKTAQDYEFSFKGQPTDLPDIRFVDGDGKAMSLTDFRGRSVLLNIWATWCVPCGKEMPSLDRLQAKFDPRKFLVLTLSIDNRGVPAVKDFYRELGLKSLGIYVDQSGKVLGQVGAPGVPTTLLVTAKGQEAGRKIGAAEWDSSETITLLREHLELPGDESGQEGSK